MDLVRLDPQWRCFFEGGGVLDLAQETAAMTANLDAFSPGSSEGYRQFLALSKRLDSISQKFFFWKPIGGIFDMFEWKNIVNPRMLLDVIAMRPTSTVAGTVRKHVPDHRVAQMLDHFTQYVGSSPYASPAVLCGIAHMQTGEGVWYPMGGTGAVPKALARLASELGVKTMTNAEVTGINQDSRGAVSGVTLASGETLPFDIAVSNSDSVRTHRELLASEQRFELCVQGTGIGLWDRNLLTGDTWYSPRLKHLLGYTDASAFSRASLSGAARNLSLRCTTIVWAATSDREIAQSTAESPPPAMTVPAPWPALNSGESSSTRIAATTASSAAPPEASTEFPASSAFARSVR